MERCAAWERHGTAPALAATTASAGWHGLSRSARATSQPVDDLETGRERDALDRAWIDLEHLEIDRQAAEQVAAQRREARAQPSRRQGDRDDRDRQHQQIGAEHRRDLRARDADE